LTTCAAGSEERVGVGWPSGDAAVGEINEEHPDRPSTLLVSSSRTSNWGNVGSDYSSQNVNDLMTGL